LLAASTFCAVTDNCDESASIKMGRVCRSMVQGTVVVSLASRDMLQHCTGVLSTQKLIAS
jgi:hypothetical protein